MPILLFLLFCSTKLCGVDFKDFDRYQNQFTREEIEYRIATFLEKDPALRECYKVTDTALYIDSYVLNLVLESKREVRKKTSLNGMKIAIDPGHFGGIYAKLEERFIDTEQAKFDEGTLTFLTALELKSLLEAEGATVFISKESIGQGAIKENFFEWLATKPELWTSADPLSTIFRRHYNRIDLHKRADVINQFGPDLTLILHYNADLPSLNYNMTFIPGAFCAGELSTEEDRYEFLRLVLTEDLNESLKLSKSILNAFTKELKVPPLQNEERDLYVKNVCLKQSEGIYSRNLALTRLVHSPLCYGETLIQNNEEESLRLNLKDCEIGGVACSSRIKQVARAYYQGIKEYLDICAP